MFEIAAGGILAAVAVPLIAHQLGAGQRDRADHTASVLLSWALLVLVPLAALLWLFAAPISSWLVDQRPVGLARSPPRLLRIFAVQVPLYGLGIILTGLLQAHRRFLAAALAPLASSIVVLVSYLWYGSIVDGQVEPSLVSDEAIRVLGWGTTLGVVVLSVPLVVPAMRTGWRWRPALRMPPDDARRIGALAGAGVIALLAQQAAVARHDVAVASRPATRAPSRSTPTPRPSTCCPTPCSPSRWPRAPSRPWRRAPARGRTSPGPSRGRCGRCWCSPRCRWGCSSRRPRPIGAFFSLLDARRGDGATSTAALAALPATLTAYAPGPGRLRPERPADPGPLRARPPHRCRHRRRHRVVRRGPASARRARRRAEPGGDPALAGRSPRRWA